MHIADNTATAIVSGAYHTCALLTDSSIVCWGLNNFGQLGDESTINIGSFPDQMGYYLQPVDLGGNLATMQKLMYQDPRD